MQDFREDNLPPALTTEIFLIGNVLFRRRVKHSLNLSIWGSVNARGKRLRNRSTTGSGFLCRNQVVYRFRSVGKKGRHLFYPASQSSLVQLSIRRSRNLGREHKPITACCQAELRRGYCEEKKSTESRKGRTKTNVTMTVNMNVSPAIPKTMTAKPKVSPIAILTTPLIAPGFTQVALSSHLGKTYLDKKATQMPIGTRRIAHSGASKNT